MNDECFKKLQQAQLDIMKEVHRVCTENDIEYYIIGGTALGAIRHKGFIPWDLDIDIAMARPHYDRFKEICATSLDQRFYYCDYTNIKNFDHPHALVCIKNTSLENKFDQFNPEAVDLGIYLDIFPLDTVPCDKKLQIKQKNKILRIKAQKNRKVAKIYDNKKIKTFIKKLVSFCMFWTSIDKLNYQLDKAMRKYNSENSDYICSMASHYSYEKQCMPKEIYGTPRLVEFENCQFFAPSQLEEYLTRIYKNYMQLPPVEQQQINYDVFVNVKFDK